LNLKNKVSTPLSLLSVVTFPAPNTFLIPWPNLDRFALNISDAASLILWFISFNFA
jgi:hypothetical protein